MLLGLAGLGSACALYGINLWLPQIIQAMGFSNRATGFIAAMPYLVSMVAMVAWARFSDTRGERHLAYRADHAPGRGGAGGRGSVPAII